MENFKFYLVEISTIFILTEKLLSAFGTKTNGKKSLLYIALISLFIGLLADNSISIISDMISSFSISGYGVALFVGVGILFLICPFIILNHNNFPRIASPLKRKIEIHKLMQYEQLVLGGLMTAIILQILITLSYHKFELIGAVAISYGTASVLMAILAFKLFRWFTISKSVVTFLFGIAVTLIEINAIVSFIYFEYVLEYQREVDIITTSIHVLFETHFPEGSFMSYIAQVQLYSFAGYFLMTWAATVLLLIHNVQRIGKSRFALIVILPIFFFLYFFAILFDSAFPDNPVTDSTPLDQMGLWVSYTYAAAIIGILIGIGFYSVARVVKENKMARSSLIITGYGFIFYFTAAFATVIQTGYPPFGLANVALVGFAAYMIYSGLYNSAVSISRDVYLRKSIRKSVLHNAKFLSSMGFGQNRQDLEQNILEISRKESDELSRSNNIYPSISDSEMKDYLNDIIAEVTKLNQNKDNLG